MNSDPITARDNVGSTQPQMIPTESRPWALLTPEIEMRMLHLSDDGETYTLMHRFQPGTVIPRHHHIGSVYAYTIAGRWFYQEYDWIAETGSFIYEPPGSTHTLEISRDLQEPTTVIFTIEKGLKILDSEDTVLGVQDGPGMQSIYEAALKLDGVPFSSTVEL